MLDKKKTVALVCILFASLFSLQLKCRRKHPNRCALKVDRKIQFHNRLHPGDESACALDIDRKVTTQDEKSSVAQLE